MVDTHCHLNFKTFDKDLSSVVRRYQEKGGEYLLVVGAKEDSSKKAIEITQQYPLCFATVGIHPHHADSLTSLLQTESLLTELVNSPKVVAIGETGLDYYQYRNSPPLSKEQKDKQLELFKLHLKIASQFKLPVIIHCRRAQEDLLNILSGFLKSHYLTGVFHCFDGTKDYLDTVLSLGFSVGFDGNITYPENEHLRRLVKLTPLDRLLVETDSPYLTPVPFRGQRNEPANLIYIISAIAEIKNETTNKIASATTNNARLLFNASISLSINPEPVERVNSC